MKKFLMALAMLATPIAATAQHYDYRNHGYSQRYDRHYYGNRNKTYAWRGRDGRYYCRRGNGTTGLVVGGIAGALLGRTIDTRGDRSVGTLGGAAAGALLGREVDRGNCR